MKKDKKYERIPGEIYGNVSNASTVYGEEKLHAVRGHGFAAERANTLYDKYTGHRAKIVGDDNAKNGADRILDGVQIQSKYCQTGSKCISECFENGKFRYYNPDGSPMQIEVPRDKYDAAIAAMKERIKRGEVSGVSDTKDAENIIRRGHFTYEQAKNIAKAGTVESLVYDAANGTIIATSTFGITAILTFATSVWNGEKKEEALKNAAFSGLKVSGTTFITAILAGQMTKAGVNSMLVGSSESLIKVIGPKGASYLANGFRNGKNIYGAAAMKSASKMVRGNVITGACSIAVLSVGDIVNLARKRISGKQFIKNTTSTTSTVIGGTGGWIGGAVAGSVVGSIVPGVGNAVGAVVGGLLGSVGGGVLLEKMTGSVMDRFVKDDRDAMVQIVDKVFADIASQYLLTEKEINYIVEEMKKGLKDSQLKDMYASKEREKYAEKLVMSYIKKAIHNRENIILSEKDVVEGIYWILEHE